MPQRRRRPADAQSYINIAACTVALRTRSNGGRGAPDYALQVSWSAMGHAEHLSGLYDRRGA